MDGPPLGSPRMSGEAESEQRALRERRVERTEASNVIVRAGSDRRHCDESGRQGNARAVRLLVYAGGECELPALDGGMAPATGGLAAGGSRGG